MPTRPIYLTEEIDKKLTEEAEKKYKGKRSRIVHEELEERYGK